MKPFGHLSVSSYLHAYIQSLPHGGRGELRKIAAFTGIHSTTMSQINKGERCLSPEQAAKLCEYLGLSELETTYLICLVHKERAGTDQLRSIYEAELQKLAAHSNEISNFVKRDRELSKEEKAQFYADWFYAGLAILSSLKPSPTVDELSNRTGLARHKVKEALSFLVRAGICWEKNGRYSPGTKSTHLDSKSPFISRHHGNWRVKAMERHPSLTNDELAYSSPMSLSEEDARKIRSMLVDTVASVARIREPSPCETAFVLNIDWIKI